VRVGSVCAFKADGMGWMEERGCNRASSAEKNIDTQLYMRAMCVAIIVREAAERSADVNTVETRAIGSREGRPQL
jgi:hypothetical protein